MLKYKTTSIPEIVHRGVNASEFKKGLTNNTVNKAVSTIGQAIEKEAKDGWVFHSIECLPQKIARLWKVIFTFNILSVLWLKIVQKRLSSSATLSVFPYFK